MVVKPLLALLAASLALLAASLGAFGPAGAATGPRPALEPLPLPRPAAAPRLLCARPGALRLRRFEDGSAQLLCGGRLLARVAVPG